MKPMNALAALLALVPVMAAGTTTWSEAASDPVTAVCTSGTETPAQPSGPWSRTATYAAGDAVTYRGTPYVSMQSSNANHTPDTDADAWWRAMGVSLWKPSQFVLATVCADPGQTITNGSFDLYLWDAKIGAWARYNRTPFATATGVRCAILDNDSSAVGLIVLLSGDKARLVVLPAGATVSSGNITVHLRTNQ